MSIGCDIEVVRDALTILAPAKINLFLSVGQRRPDGYHLIDTVMSTVGLCDRVRVEPASALRLMIEGDVYLEGKPDNLCLVAARELASYAGLKEVGAYITVDKRIPVGAGLGGGSADAAATLLLLNRLWKLSLTVEQLRSVARTIGTDVPFCVQGGVARGTGIGADITGLAASLPVWFIIANPRIGISTQQAYSWLDEQRSSAHFRTPDDMITCIQRQDYKGVIGCLHNDFQPIITRHIKEVNGLVNLFHELQVPALMSGSGSSVIGFITDPVSTRCIVEAIQSKGADVWLVPSARARIEKE